MKFLDIEITKKLYIKILIISLIAIVVLMALTMSSLLVFKSYTLGIDTVVNDEGMNMHIDILEHDSKKVEIAGWAYYEGEKLGKVNSNYVLENQETRKMYLMRTKMEENINITDEEYKLSGMHAQCLTFGIPKGIYNIYVLYNSSNKNILANTSIQVEL